MLTYGDGVSDVNIKKLVDFHRSHGKLATMTAVRPEGRFGIIDFGGNQIKAFREKSQDDTGWINGCFMVFQPEIFNYIDATSNDECDCITTGELVDLFCKKWGNGQKWVNQPDGGPHEANFLKSDCSKLKSVFGWRPRWDIEQARGNYHRDLSIRLYKKSL